MEFDLEDDLDLPPPLAGLRDEPRLNPAKLGMSGIVTGCEKENTTSVSLIARKKMKRNSPAERIRVRASQP